jgi:hypothetical protein
MHATARGRFAIDREKSQTSAIKCGDVNGRMIESPGAQR